MGAEHVLLVIVIILAFPRLRVWWKRFANAIRDANTFEPVNRLSALYVDLKTNTWQEEPISSQTIWWRVFLNSLKGKPL